MIDIIWDQAHNTPRNLAAAPANDCRRIGVAHDCRAVALQDCRALWPEARRATASVQALRPHALLRTLPLDDEYQVAFVPSCSQIAVLSRAACRLLERLPLGADSHVEELEAVEQLFALGLLSDGDRAIPAPAASEVLVAWLHLTNACNLRCGYCYIQKSGESMSIATAQDAVDAVVRAAIRHGYPAIALKYAGGEASLRMALVEQTHRYAQAQAARHGLALQAGLLSNGTALTPRRLARIAAMGLRLMISLDGLAADNDTSRLTIGGAGSSGSVTAGIERALAAGIVPDIAITVTSASVDGLPDLLAWLLDRDLPFSLSFYREPSCGGASRDLHADAQRMIAGMRRAYAVIARRPPRWSLTGALLDRADLAHAHRRTCAVGENYLVIDHHGQVAKCQMVLDQPVSHIRADDPLGMIRLDQAGVRNLAVEEKAGCRSCDWRYWCAGGCAVATHRATGSYDARSPNCAIYQSLCPDVIRLEGLRLLHWHQLAIRA
ncbi:MAG: radical SAM protein [Chloroflexales bacterium]